MKNSVITYPKQKLRNVDKPSHCYDICISWLAKYFLVPQSYVNRYFGLKGASYLNIMTELYIRDNVRCVLIVVKKTP